MQIAVRVSVFGKLTQTAAVPALRMSLQYDRRSMLQISALAPLAVVAPGVVKKASAAEDEAYDPSKFEPLIKDLEAIVKADKWFVSPALLHALFFYLFQTLYLLRSVDETVVLALF